MMQELFNISFIKRDFRFLLKFLAVFTLIFFLIILFFILSFGLIYILTIVLSFLFLNIFFIFYASCNINSGLFSSVVYKIKCNGCIALTFDDGPDPQTTLVVLDLLDKYQQKATFFLIGKKIDKYPQIVSEILKRGHSIGIHSYSHNYFLAFRSVKGIKDELEKWIQSYKKVTGMETILFRPPVGIINPSIQKAAGGLSLEIIGWNLRARDAVCKDKNKIISRVINKIKDGDILLLHDSPEYEEKRNIFVSHTALPEILSYLNENGIKSVALPMRY